MPIKHFNYRAASSFYYIFVVWHPFLIPLSLSPRPIYRAKGSTQRSERAATRPLHLAKRLGMQVHSGTHSYFIFPKSNQDKFLKYMQVFYVENLALFTFQ